MAARPVVSVVAPVVVAVAGVLVVTPTTFWETSPQTRPKPATVTASAPALRRDAKRRGSSARLARDAVTGVSM